MAVRGEMVWQVTGELRALRSVVDGLSAGEDWPTLVAPGEEGLEIWSYGELAGHGRCLARGLLGAGGDREDHVALLAANRKE